jgi:uncharacterized protein YoxC
MQLTADIALIIGCLSIAGTVVSVVIFLGKLKWEIDGLKRENESQEKKIEELLQGINDLRQKGSAPTENLEKRIASLEVKFDKFLEKFQELFIDVKALGKTGPRSRAGK